MPTFDNYPSLVSWRGAAAMNHVEKFVTDLFTVSAWRYQPGEEAIPLPPLHEMSGIRIDGYDWTALRWRRSGGRKNRRGTSFSRSCLAVHRQLNDSAYRPLFLRLTRDIRDRSPILPSLITTTKQDESQDAVEVSGGISCVAVEHLLRCARIRWLTLSAHRYFPFRMGWIVMVDVGGWLVRGVGTKLGRVEGTVQ